MKKAMLFEQEIQGLLPVWSFSVVCSGVQLLWLVLLPNSCQCTDLRHRVMQILCIVHRAQLKSFVVTDVLLLHNLSQLVAMI